MSANLTTQTNAVTSELLARFIAYVDASPKTVETYTRALRQFFVYLSTNSIARPQRPHILAFREMLRQQKSAATVQNYMTVVRLFFKWAESEGLYPNVASGVKGANIARGHRTDYLTTAQITSVLQNVDRSYIMGLRDYAMIALMVTGGLRTIEVSRANVGDMRPRGDETVLYIQGKGQHDKTDYVKLPGPVEEALRGYLNARNGGEAMFTSLSNNSRGERLTTRSVSAIVKNRMIAAGLNSSRLSAHSLRHTAGTLNLLNGGTLEETQQLLRHRDISTTMIYLHHLEREQNKSESRIAGAIFGEL